MIRQRIQHRLSRDSRKLDSKTHRQQEKQHDRNEIDLPRRWLVAIDRLRRRRPPPPWVFNLERWLLFGQQACPANRQRRRRADDQPRQQQERKSRRQRHHLQKDESKHEFSSPASRQTIEPAKQVAIAALPLIGS